MRDIVGEIKKSKAGVQNAVNETVFSFVETDVKRRQLQNYLEEIKKIRPLQEGNITELEKFADILVFKVITLREHNRESELEPGSLLFSLVVEKIRKTMLSRYFRWASESHRFFIMSLCLTSES